MLKLAWRQTLWSMFPSVPLGLKTELQVKNTAMVMVKRQETRSSVTFSRVRRSADQ